MGARELLDELVGAGLSVAVDGDDRLVVRPASLLTDDMRVAVRQAKPELLALLRADDPPRRFRLTRTEADEAHAEPWDDAACARFVVRVRRLLRIGVDASDADDLAERLHLRDVRRDDSVLCLECKHLACRAAAAWRCANHRDAGLLSPELGRDLAEQLQRCAGFSPANRHEGTR